MENRYITLKEAASTFGLNYGFYRNLYLQGKLKGFRSGVKIFLDRENVASVLNTMAESGDKADGTI